MFQPRCYSLHSLSLYGLVDFCLGAWLAFTLILSLWQKTVNPGKSVIRLLDNPEKSRLISCHPPGPQPLGSSDGQVTPSPQRPVDIRAQQLLSLVEWWSNGIQGNLTNAIPNLGRNTWVGISGKLPKLLETQIWVIRLWGKILQTQTLLYTHCSAERPAEPGTLGRLPRLDWIDCIKPGANKSIYAPSWHLLLRLDSKGYCEQATD